MKHPTRLCVEPAICALLFFSLITTVLVQWLNTKAPGPPLIYLVGPLAISDPHINICVGPPNTCIALKQFNLLPPNTLL